jgi:hypothetical protein
MNCGILSATVLALIVSSALAASKPGFNQVMQKS